MRSKKISRRVWRFLASYTRSAKVGCSINSLSVRHRLLQLYYATIRRACSEFP